MIRVPSETFGSMMVQHGAKSRNLYPRNFNMEMYLRVNLRAFHYSDGLINDIRLYEIVSKDTPKRDSVANFEKRDETKSCLTESFWSYSSSK